jgi:hypothetical protein
LCNFFETYIYRDCRLSKIKVADREAWQKHLKMIFGYCFIWSFGANYSLAALRVLDHRIREIFSSIRIPEADAVFDYHFSEKL